VGGKCEGGGREERELTGAVIGHDRFRANEEKFLKIKVGQLISNGAVVNYEAANRIFGVDITQLQYWTIMRAVSRLLNNPANRIANVQRNWKLTLCRSARGSRIFRKILEKNRDWSGMVCERFANVVGLEKPENFPYGEWCSLWNNASLPIPVRLFVFQLNGNSLPVKARLSHRRRLVGIDEGCNTCAAGFDVKTRETFKHVFFECEPVRSVINSYNRKYNGNEAASMSDIFFGTDRSGEYNIITHLIGILLLYNIWQIKVSNRRIGWLTVEENMFQIFEAIVKCNKNIYTLACNSNHSWCRHWSERQQHGRG